VAAFGADWPSVPISVPARDHLEWKMSSPQLVPDHASVVELDGQLIGYWGSINRDVWFDGERCAGRFGVDKLIDPEFQGQGLSSIHREWLKNERPSTVAAVNAGVHSNHARLLASANRRGARVLTGNEVQLLRRPVRVGATALDAARRADARRVLGALRSALRLVAGRLRYRPRRGAASLSVEDVVQFDEGADALWSRVRSDFDYAVVRDRAYLNWRYCDPRAGDYSVRSVTRAGELLGFMVSGVRSGELVVVDYLASDAGALDALIADALGTANRDELPAVSVVLPRQHRDRETFLRAGFLVAGVLANHGHTPGISRAVPRLTDPRARIHVALGDEDAV
jgi:hypothetical protein